MRSLSLPHALTSLLRAVCPLLGALFFVTALQAAEQTTSSTAACALCPGTQQAALTRWAEYYNTLDAEKRWPSWVKGQKITPGQDDARIPVLREILLAADDYKADAILTANDSTLYDTALQNAVSEFQKRHGLTPDGVIGAATQQALSITPRQRMRKIQATLRRLSSTTIDTAQPLLLVNIPAYRLWALADGKEVLSMRVIVGDVKHPTPFLDEHVTTVIFNPHWYVPPSIAEKELLPKLKENPQYFIDHGYVVTQHKEPVNPLSLPHEAIDDPQPPIVFRQEPGAKNVLGKIKFDLRNRQNIYLHSTASPALFNKDMRALSHGCIRVESPQELAYFVMQPLTQWPRERVDEAFTSEKQRHVAVEGPRVVTVYWTAWVDAGGTLHFSPDIYKLDAATP